MLDANSPLIENVVLPRVKSVQKIAITNGINTRKLGAFCLLLSLVAFVVAFIKTSGSAVSLYHRALDDRSFGLFKSSEPRAWAANYFDTLQDEHEANKERRKQAADNVTQFMGTDTRKYVTLTFNSCGGLANMIWRFASIYGIGRQTGRRPFIDHQRSCWKRTMPEFASSIPGLAHATIYQRPSKFLTKRVSYGINCCRYDNVSRLTQFYSMHKYVYLRGNILQSYKYFHEFKPEIREIFEFSQPLKDYVHLYTNELYGNDTSHKVCIHTRLGDFKKHFLLESRLDFTQPAVGIVGQMLKARYGNITLSAVLIGQDRDFLKKINIPREHYITKYTIENLNRAEEIYFGSAMCDSMLLTASGSTFGWWMAYLMPEHKQQNVFYNIQASKDLTFGKDVYDYDSYLPKWNRLRLLSNKSVVLEPRWRHQIIADEGPEINNADGAINGALPLLANGTFLINRTASEGNPSSLINATILANGTTLNGTAVINVNGTTLVLESGTKINSTTILLTNGTELNTTNFLSNATINSLTLANLNGTLINSTYLIFTDGVLVAIDPKSLNGTIFKNSTQEAEKKQDEESKPEEEEEE